MGFSNVNLCSFLIDFLVLIRNWYTYISVEWNEESGGIFAVAVSIRTTEAIQFLVLVIGLKGECMSFSAGRKENRPNQRCDWAPFRRRPCPFCIARCAPRSWWGSWRRPPCSRSLPLHRSSCLQTEAILVPHRNVKCTTGQTQNYGSIMDCEEIDIAYILQLSFRRLNPQEIENALKR